MKPRIGVVVVDDSALMRKLLTSMLMEDPGIEVLGAAADPYAAREMIRRTNPDVLTLDIEMPKMDGLAFLEKIMSLRPMPVVMVSSLTQEGAEATIQALELGAVEIIAKPTSDLEAGLAGKQEEIIRKVKAAASARVRPSSARPAREKSPIPRGASFRSTEKVILIGASTGGVEMLSEIIRALPADSPAVMITQHMPGGFTRSFANRMDKISRVRVSEAEEGQRVLPGHVLIAPGNRHLELDRSGANYVCRLSDGSPVSGHRPSVDVLFHSAAIAAGANAVAAILTGMGKDGATGLLEMRKAGARTFGQDEATSVVYGMPKVAWECGAVEKQLPISRMAGELLDACAENAKLREIRV
jgi:two-component system chemotaxis response regulator CheB